MPFLLIDKPTGMTSHDVVDRVRKVTGERTVGHAGTLDPFATGLLIIGVGRESTKHLNTFLGMGKTYEATIRLGESSTTLDPEGEVLTVGGDDVTADAIESAMKSLTGDILQIPPMHSAIKIGGKKLYELARKGIEIERPARAVTISRLTLQNAQDGNPSIAQGVTADRPSEAIALPLSLPVTIDCSSGTYIRAIARDLGEKLGTAGYLTQLRRTAIGEYSVKDAVKLNDLTKENWVTLAKKLVA